MALTMGQLGAASLQGAALGARGHRDQEVVVSPTAVGLCPTEPAYSCHIQVFSFIFAISVL